MIIERVIAIVHVVSNPMLKVSDEVIDMIIEIFRWI